MSTIHEAVFFTNWLLFIFGVWTHNWVGAAIVIGSTWFWRQGQHMYDEERRRRYYRARIDNALAPHERRAAQDEWAKS
jgi:hypothetical protein